MSRGVALHPRRLAKPRLRAWGVLLLTMLFLPACSGYQLRGKVIEGRVSSVAVVDAADPRLEQPGLPGVTVQSVLDPRAMGQKRLPTATTGDDGTFAVPVREAGAGVLRYTVQVVGRRTGFQGAAETFPLPGGGQRVLITLNRGRDTLPGAPGDVVEETLRMSEPFMRE